MKTTKKEEIRLNVSCDNFKDVNLDKSVEQNIVNLRTILGNTMDLNVMNIIINKVPCAVVTIEAMVSTAAMSELMFQPMMALEGTEADSGKKIMDFVTHHSLMANERIIIYRYGEAITQLFSGFALVFADGVGFAAAFGIQGYDKKSISTPTTENNIFGSQEAFAEVIRTNISLIRRRMKHPSLRFEMMQVGELSNTDVCIVYIQGKTDEKIVEQIRKKLSSIKLDSILSTGYVHPFLEERSDELLFSEIGYTEKPDMMCANLIQGRVGVLIDGTPFALVCPTVFTQNFNTVDDYASKTYYAGFLKIIRYMAFIFATAFPGIYLAAINYNPEMLNLKLLTNLAASEKTTIMPLFSELVIIMLLLEIMREASIRLPHAVGSAMSIAGGLIIGDSAVKSGIISSPLLIIVGVTATASFVLPQLNQQTALLRIIFIAAGGFAGFFGIAACSIMVLANICSQSFMTIPFTSPLSPFRKKQAADVLARKTYNEMQQENTTIKDYS